MTGSHHKPEQAYYDTLSEVDRKKLRYMRFIALMAILVVVIQVGSSYLGRQQILDCTDPDRQAECYTEGAERQEDAIALLVSEIQKAMDSSNDRQTKVLLRQILAEVANGESNE